MQIYCLWDPMSNQVLRARDVSFDEDLQDLSAPAATVVLHQPYESVPASPLLEYKEYNPLQAWKPNLLSFLSLHFDALPDPLYLELESEIAQVDQELPVATDLPVKRWGTDKPATLNDARKSPDWHFWEAAIHEQIDRMESLQIYTVVDHPGKDHPVIPSRWVFARKPDNSGRTVRFRARWVAKGFLQKRGVHFH